MNIKKYLKQMTVADKARLLCGTNFCSFGRFDTAAGPIPEVRIQDGGTGINFGHLVNHPDFFDMTAVSAEQAEQGSHVMDHFYEPDVLSSTEKEMRNQLHAKLVDYRNGIDCAPGCYPPGILLGATWNPKVVYETGRALGLEASVYHIGVLLGTPNVNILREPVNGRFFEGYSEDPFLAKSLAPEMCKGVESMGVASNVKHFACNNLEINRTLINELVSMRALREIYFPAFEACSKVASTLMSAYVSINGTHCHENQWLLKDVLREEWGYPGMTVTDWDACKERAGDAVGCGQDLFMPGPYDPSDIVKAVEEERLSMKDLDQAAMRILELIDRFADIQAPDGLTEAKYKKFGDKAAYQAAAEGIVMLKNTKCLPLKNTSKVVFFGPERFQDSGKGSAQVATDRWSTLSAELGRVLGEDRILRNDMEAYQKGATAIVIATIDSSEGADRPNLKLSKKTLTVIKKLIKNRGRGKICLILNVPGPVELEGLEDAVDAIFAVFYPGMMGARAMADILTGKINPSGALPCTFPISYEDTPAYLCYPDNLTCMYGEGIYVGYRGYQKRGVRVLFPFGYGLSYSKFAAKEFCVSRKGERISVTCSLSNTSKLDGKAVVQLYVSKYKAQTPRAKTELVGFAKPLVKAGSTSKVTITFDKQELAYFDEEYNQFLVENGKYELFISLRGCEDLIPAGSIYIADGSEELKCGPSWNLRQISAVPALVDALRKDCNALGIPFIMFESNAIYMPAMKVREVFGEAIDQFVAFKRACEQYKSE